MSHRAGLALALMHSTRVVVLLQVEEIVFQSGGPHRKYAAGTNNFKNGSQLHIVRLQPGVVPSSLLTEDTLNYRFDVLNFVYVNTSVFEAAGTLCAVVVRLLEATQPGDIFKWCVKAFAKRARPYTFPCPVV